MSLYTINNEMVPVFRGQFAPVNTEAGEFSFNTDDTETPKSTLLGIADGAGLKVNKKLNAAEFRVKLADALLTLKLPEVNKMTESQIIENAITEGVKEKLSHDDMLINIVKAGVGFATAAKKFAKALEEKGLVLSKKNQKVQIDEILGDKENKDIDYADYENVSKMTEYLIKEVTGLDSLTALKALRKFGKDNDITMGKKPTVAKSEVFNNWLVENVGTADEKSVLAKLTELGALEKTHKKHLKNFAFGQACFKAGEEAAVAAA